MTGEELKNRRFRARDGYPKSPYCSIENALSISQTSLKRLIVSINVLQIVLPIYAVI